MLHLKKYITAGFITVLGLLFLTFAGCEDNPTPTDSVNQQSDAQLDRVGPPPGVGNAPAVQKGLVYELKATNARLNREVLGPVTDDVMGVPAEPVHSFVWDGEGSVELDYARATYEIDPVNNSGKIYAEWKDRNGHWTYEQTQYALPPHPTGLRIAPDAGGTVLVEGDPVPVDVYLHGNTGAAGPVLPTLFNNLATWGPAVVTLNGEVFENPYDGPAPLWFGHTMTTPGVRNADGQVLTTDGSFYNPMKAAQGFVDYTDMEFHLTWHDAPGPEMTENFPPPLSFFYHLTFEDVKLEVKHAE